MKKDFQNFQNAFYEKVNNTAIFSQVYTYLQITPVPGILGESTFLDVTFSYREVTGRENTESILIEATDDANVAFERFRDELKKAFPGFVRFNSLEEAIETAIEVDDEDLEFRYMDLDRDIPDIVVYTNHRDLCMPCDHQNVYILLDDEDQMRLTFNPAETTIEEMMTEVKHEFYSEWDEE